jgi:hypothetical protein
MKAFFIILISISLIAHFIIYDAYVDNTIKSSTDVKVDRMIMDCAPYILEGSIRVGDSVISLTIDGVQTIKSYIDRVDTNEHFISYLTYGRNSQWYIWEVNKDFITLRSKDLSVIFIPK